MHENNTCASAGGDTLAVCVSIKDQPDEINEWIQYHLSIGVDQCVCRVLTPLLPHASVTLTPVPCLRSLYVMDNNSTVPLAPLLQEHVCTG